MHCFCMEAFSESLGPALGPLALPLTCDAHPRGLFTVELGSLDKRLSPDCTLSSPQAGAMSVLGPLGILRTGAVSGLQKAADIFLE